MTKIIIENESSLPLENAIRFVQRCAEEGYPKIGFYPGVVAFERAVVIILKNKKSIKYLVRDKNG